MSAASNCRDTCEPGKTVDPLLLWPDPPPIDVVRALDMAGIPWVGWAGDDATLHNKFAGAIVAADESPDRGYLQAKKLRRGEFSGEFVMLLIRGTQLQDLGTAADLYDDFCVVPFHPLEFETRIRHLLAGTVSHQLESPELIEYDALTLNVETYQAHLNHRPLDLTYMEYELLKFLASQPGRVFSRETLLTQVWGYDYYGGARTVDVHIRRLRAKLTEEYAGLIQTVRSVGYRFGESRWDRSPRTHDEAD